MFLVYDVETTGLVPCNGFNNYPHFTENDKYDESRIVEISWIVLDEYFHVIEEKKYIVKRDNFNIPSSSFHNITNQISDIKGIDFNIIMQDFDITLDKCKYLVAHNILFDYNVLANHLYRYNIKQTMNKLISKNLFCTSQESKDILQIPLFNDSDGILQYKLPSLQELHFYYFNSYFENAHDSLTDTLICTRCFIKILETKKIQ